MAYISLQEKRHFTCHVGMTVCMFILANAMSHDLWELLDVVESW